MSCLPWPKRVSPPRPHPLGGRWPLRGRPWALLVAGACLACARSPEFSAVRVALRGDITLHRQRLWWAPGMLRIESAGPTGTDTLVAILRRDVGVRYLVNPRTQTYARDSLTVELWQRSTLTGWRSVGPVLAEETVHGYRCAVLPVTGLVGFGLAPSCTLWHSARIPLPLKVTDGTHTVELSSIVEAPQPRRLFQPPPGSTQVPIGHLLAPIPEGVPLPRAAR